MTSGVERSFQEPQSLPCEELAPADEEKDNNFLYILWTNLFQVTLGTPGGVQKEDPTGGGIDKAKMLASFCLRSCILAVL